MFYFGAENYDGTVTGFPKSFLPAEMRTKYVPFGFFVMLAIFCFLLFGLLILFSAKPIIYDSA